MTMVVNKIEYHQIRKYLLFVVLAGLIYSVYSIVVVYYDNKAIKAGPIKSYEIVSKHSGAINISSYIIVRYRGKDYTVTVSRKDINEGKLYSHPLKTIFQHKACTDKLYADSFYKVQKNSHSSFEVICCRS